MKRLILKVIVKAMYNLWFCFSLGAGQDCAFVSTLPIGFTVFKILGLEWVLAYVSGSIVSGKCWLFHEWRDFDVFGLFHSRSSFYIFGLRFVRLGYCFSTLDWL